MHYYNIKIKSGNGEYCLESQNKEITQREMDLYFGLMFGASKEFMDKIKKVTVTAKVNSIEEFVQKETEKTTFETNLPQKNTPKALINSNDDFEQIENPKEELQFKPVAEEELVFIEENKEEEKEEEILEIQETKEETVSIPETVTLPEIVSIKEEVQPVSIEQTANIEPDVIPIDDNNEIENETTVEQSEIQPPSETEPQQVQIQTENQEENKNLNKTIELVQQAINNIDISSDETFDIDIPDVYNQKKLEEEDFEFSEEEEKQINAIISPTQENQSEEKNIQFAPQEIVTLKETEEQNSTQQEKTETNNDEIQFIDLDNDSKLPVLDVSKQEEPKQNEMASIFSDESNFKAPPESQNIIAAKVFDDNNSGVKLDFKVFLQNYQHNGLIDEFLICAYYIKHITKQDNFSMKYINSKLFQSTGNIADLTVANNLVNSGHIKVIETETGKKYSITSSGEEYFMTTYQR